jgi:hypothetical protein
MTHCKNLFLVTLLTTCFALAAFAQKAPITFGKIDVEDLKMKFYPKDSSASAVILCDYGEAHMDVTTSVNQAQYDIIYTFHRRVRIFKADPSVMAYFANIEIPYRRYDTRQQDVVSKVQGAVYVLNDGLIQTTKLEKSGIFDKEEFKNYFTKKLTMPGVKDGCIIEYSYQIKSSLFYEPRTWYFQHPFPTRWSEYRFSFLEYYVYAYNQEGYNKLTVNEKGTDALSLNVLVVDKASPTQGNSNFGGIPSSGTGSSGTVNETLKVWTNRWAMADVPALRNEVYITTPVDYYDKIEFQLNAIKPYGSSGRQSDITFSDSWEKFVKDELKTSSMKKLNQRDAIKDLTKSLTKDKTTPMDKVAAISNHIKTNISVQNGFFWATADERSNEEVILKKAGTVRDINLLFGAMLLEAGLKVTPVLMSTRSHGRVAKNYPLEDRFNYMIMSVNIDGKEVLLDAVNAALPATVLPFDLLNGEGLLMDPKKPIWVDLQAAKMVDLTNADVTIENGKTLKGTVATTQKSYEGWNSRLKISQEGADKHAKKMLEKLIGNGKLTSQKFDNLTNSNDPLKGSFTFETGEFMDVNKERIYLNPMLSFGEKENPFKKKERLFPVDFAHPSDDIYNFSLKVPAGYAVEELPKPMNLKWDDGSINFQYIVAPANADGVVKITSKLTIKKPVFSAEEYEDLKKTFDQIVAKHAEQIVLKKNK